MNWQYKWSYFGDIVTMLQGETCLEEIQDYRNYFLWDCMETYQKQKGDDELLHTLSRVSSLVSSIQNLPIIRKRGRRRGDHSSLKYAWTESWREDKLNVVIGDMSEIPGINECFVTLDTLYIPWPLPVIGGKALKSILGNFKPVAIPREAFNPRRHVLIDRVFACLDHIVENPDEVGVQIRNELRAARENFAKVHQIVEKYANTVLQVHLEGFKLPMTDHFLIDIQPDMLGTATSLKRSEDTLILTLGLVSHNRGAQFDKWPSGPFGGD